MKYFDRNSLMIVVGVAIFTIFFGIGGVPLLDPDEPVYAETAREMIQFGDFLSPRIFGEYWYDKPPITGWLHWHSLSLVIMNLLHVFLLL